MRKIMGTLKKYWFKKSPKNLGVSAQTDLVNNNSIWQVFIDNLIIKATPKNKKTGLKKSAPSKKTWDSIFDGKIKSARDNQSTDHLENGAE